MVADEVVLDVGDQASDIIMSHLERIHFAVHEVFTLLVGYKPEESASFGAVGLLVLRSNTLNFPGKLSPCVQVLLQGAQALGLFRFNVLVSWGLRFSEVQRL